MVDIFTTGFVFGSALQIWNIFLRMGEEAELAQGEESELIADRLS